MKKASLYSFSFIHGGKRYKMKFYGLNWDEFRNHEDDSFFKRAMYSLVKYRVDKTFLGVGKITFVSETNEKESKEQKMVNLYSPFFGKEELTLDNKLFCYVVSSSFEKTINEEFTCPLKFEENPLSDYIAILLEGNLPKEGEYSHLLILKKSNK